MPPLKTKLSEARKECMNDEKGFDYCVENLVFKKLRDAGYLDKLNDLKIETFDKIFTEQTWNSGLPALFMTDLMGKQKKTKDPRHMKPIIRDPGTRKHVRTVPKMHQNLDTFPEVGILKKAKGRKIVSEPRAMQIAAFYNIILSENPTKLGRSPVSIRKKNNISDNEHPWEKEIQQEISRDNNLEIYTKPKEIASIEEYAFKEILR